MMIRNNQNRKPSTLLQLSTVAVLLLFGGAFFSRCASVGAPSGGPLDSLAPVVLEVLPHI